MKYSSAVEGMTLTMDNVRDAGAATPIRMEWNCGALPAETSTETPPLLHKRTILLSARAPITPLATRKTVNPHGLQQAAENFFRASAEHQV